MIKVTPDHGRLCSKLDLFNNSGKSHSALMCMARDKQLYTTPLSDPSTFPLRLITFHMLKMDLTSSLGHEIRLL